MKLRRRFTAQLASKLEHHAGPGAGVALRDSEARILDCIRKMSARRSLDPRATDLLTHTVDAHLRRFGPSDAIDRAMSALLDGCLSTGDTREASPRDAVRTTAAQAAPVRAASPWAFHRWRG